MAELIENDNQSEETVEQRSDRAYQEAKQTVLSGSKETSKEGKEVPKESQETPMGNTPMTVQPGNTAITKQPAVPLSEKSTSTTITRQRKPATTSKSVDTDALIVKMKEQIRLIEHVSQVDTEISTEGLSKEGREVLIGFQRAIDKCKADTVTAIQAL